MRPASRGTSTSTFIASGGLEQSLHRLGSPFGSGWPPIRRRCLLSSISRGTTVRRCNHGCMDIRVQPRQDSSDHHGKSFSGLLLNPASAGYLDSLISRDPVPCQGYEGNFQGGSLSVWICVHPHQPPNARLNNLANRNGHPQSLEKKSLGRLTKICDGMENSGKMTISFLDPRNGICLDGWFFGGWGSCAGFKTKPMSHIPVCVRRSTINRQF